MRQKISISIRGPWLGEPLLCLDDILLREDERQQSLVEGFLALKEKDIRMQADAHLLNLAVVLPEVVEYAACEALNGLSISWFEHIRHDEILVKVDVLLQGV